jgi:hypothetical protein
MNTFSRKHEIPIAAAEIHAELAAQNGGKFSRNQKLECLSEAQRSQKKP